MDLRFNLAFATTVAVLLLWPLCERISQGWRKRVGTLNGYMAWTAVAWFLMLPFSVGTEATGDPAWTWLSMPMVLQLDLTLAFYLALIADTLIRRDIAKNEARWAWYVQTGPRERPAGFLPVEEVQRRSAVMRRRLAADNQITVIIPRHVSRASIGAITAEFEVIPEEELARRAADAEPLPPIPRPRIIPRRPPAQPVDATLLREVPMLPLWRRLTGTLPSSSLPRGTRRAVEIDGTPYKVPYARPWHAFRDVLRRDPPRRRYFDDGEPVVIPRRFPFSIGDSMRVARYERACRKNAPHLVCD